MPVIVVGADTPVGEEIIEALLEPEREVRAFVSSADTATELRRKGVKVATGDVSDLSHVEGASLNCFSAVLIAEAAHDGRQRAFASTPSAVLDGWASAVRGVQRVIWVGIDPPSSTGVGEVASLPADSSHGSIADRVAELDGLDREGFRRATGGRG
jgi:putative NADH-flavin reductase